MGRKRREPGGGLTRRQMVAAAIASVGLAAVPAPASAAPFRTATRAQHNALAVTWGYPFSQTVLRRAGVDGYEGSSYPGHRGVDYFAEPRVGTPVHAVADGVVEVVSDPGDDTGLGQYVRIAHAAGTFSTSGHLVPGSPPVLRGARVRRGDVIGATGWSGQVVPKTPSTAHLHLMIHSGPLGDPLIWNPVWLVDAAPRPQPTPTEDDDMPYLVETVEGHIYTIAPMYLRHETSITDVQFLQTVYPRYIRCQNAAQFRALTSSLSIPSDIPAKLRASGGGKSWSLAEGVWSKVLPRVDSWGKPAGQATAQHQLAAALGVAKAALGKLNSGG